MRGGDPSLRPHRAPSPRRFNPLTTDEARCFLTAAQGRWRAALFELVLRKSELLGLHRESLGLDTGTAAIRRALPHTHTGGLSTLPTKTISSERRIALPTSSARPSTSSTVRWATSPRPPPSPATATVRPCAQNPSADAAVKMP